MKKITGSIFLLLFTVGSCLHAQININGREFTTSGKMTFSCHQDADCQNISSTYLDITADSIFIYTWYQKKADPDGEAYSSSWDYLRRQAVAIKDIYHWHGKKDKPVIHKSECEMGPHCSTGEKQFLVLVKCKSRHVYNHKYDDNNKNEVYQSSSISVNFNDKNEAEEFVGLFLKK